MHAEAQNEHRWLAKLVGEWTYEVEASAEPGAPAEKLTGSESVRGLGDLWVLAEGRGEMPGGGSATTLTTLGYDAQKQRYIGTWIASMMPMLWVYDGECDPSGRILTLSAEGPAMSGSGTTMYQDVIELIDDDHRTLTARMLAEDGTWQELMTAHYSRVA